MVGGSLLWFLVTALTGPDILAAQTSVPASTSAPLTLPGLLDRVNRQHPVMAAARAQIRSAEGSRRTAAVLPNPMLGYQLENVRLPGGDPVPMDREAMATATIPLEFIYQRGSRVDKANAEVRAAEAEAQTIRQHLALEATRSYYETALAQVELSTALDLAGWLDSLVEYNRTRSKEGVSAEADLIRAQLERDRAWAEVTMQEVKLAHARAKLAAFIGDSVDTISPASEPTVTVPDEPLPLPHSASSVMQPASGRTPISELLNKRPEIQAARERLAAASSGVGVARSLLIRELGAMVGLKRTAGTSSLMAGMSLPLPIFDQNRGDIARARAERDLAAAELANTERTVGAEIRGALEGARLLSQRAQRLVGSGAGQPVRFLVRAAEARRISVGAYQEGAVPLLQVLDAARAWGEARVTFYGTLFAQHESIIALFAAQGSDLFGAIPALSARPVSSGTGRGGEGQ
ncbi:MAG TPA: TolC family protein [Gemmatimonadales bacterium]|nr:TolC family protein [Gemmatimonadales bacterium]